MNSKREEEAEANRGTGMKGKTNESDEGRDERDLNGNQRPALMHTARTPGVERVEVQKRSVEEERLRAHVCRLQMENDAMRKELRATEEMSLANEDLIKDYAKTINELYQLCTHLKAELAEVKAHTQVQQKEVERSGGGGDAGQPTIPPPPPPQRSPAQLLKFKTGLR